MYLYLLQQFGPYWFIKYEFILFFIWEMGMGAPLDFSELDVAFIIFDFISVDTVFDIFITN
jgi:hypothetical protein